ncbi:uncharacterized protein TNIN_413071 [Trichonephila inaurata madagascariensis]|uniref:2',3'-cyclic-nucleotide 3'-phosphodiesterase n=1 Tax=Trichonephila inaurata madagascariensis TaxID=2747483 RepID=A0A8X6X0I9_9ARAC|nr:uncharacterized protein TNIN_413071 [Trichonephila inaurata madagascariensis]
MFLIRGPPGTGKATLSEMINEKYPKAAFCCADDYFKNSFASPTRSKNSLKLSHDYCQNKAKTACANDSRIVIVQNTHMRKWEVQYYLNLAACYNYTVIMAITLYRFDVTPKTLVANNTDGLDYSYLRKRLNQWEDIPPTVTGWFLCPKDASYLQYLALNSLKALIGDGMFCRVFDMYDTDEVANYFKARRLQFCLAGYATDSLEMKEYYLSNIVQYLYGKCFTIQILGYHITLSGVSAIVHVNDIMELLMYEGKNNFSRSCDFSNFMNALGINDNPSEHGKTMAFKDESEPPETSTAILEEWKENEDISASKCSFIHLAQRSDDICDVGKLKKAIQLSLLEAADDKSQIPDASFIELDNGSKICRIKQNEWLVKAPMKVNIKTTFTGLYV